jgi:hypothetical protein
MLEERTNVIINHGNLLRIDHLCGNTNLFTIFSDLVVEGRERRPEICVEISSESVLWDRLITGKQAVESVDYVILSIVMGQRPKCIQFDQSSLLHFPHLSHYLSDEISPHQAIEAPLDQLPQLVVNAFVKI